MAAEVILVIEDDVHIGGLVVQVLREAGFAPALVRDVRAARDWGSAGQHARGRAQRSHGRGIGRAGAAAGGAGGDLPRRAARADDRRAAATPRGARRHARTDHRKTVRARGVDRHCPQHDRGAGAMKIVPGAAGFVATAAGRPADARRSRVAIGNFDGVHLGHAALLAEARARAGAARRPVRGVDLHAPPGPAVRARRAPPLIMSLERRLELLAEAGIDVAIVEPFTRDFAAIDAPRVRARRAGARSRRARRRRRLRLQLRPRAAPATRPCWRARGRGSASTSP